MFNNPPCFLEPMDTSKSTAATAEGEKEDETSVLGEAKEALAASAMLAIPFKYQNDNTLEVGPSQEIMYNFGTRELFSDL